MMTSDLNIPRIRQLYEERRFLDAFALTGDIWQQPELAAAADAEALVLGARLAARLGNSKIERALYRYVLQTFPAAPLTRVYARGSTALHTAVFEYLKDFEREPRLATDDPKLNLYWLCQNAHLWALVRDFERAEALLAQAAAFDCDAAWLLTSQAHVALSQDAWEQALEFAEQAWALETGLKEVFTANVLADCLTKLGRLAEAVTRLDQCVDASQCYQLATMTVWYLLAAAEHAQGDDQVRLFARCHAIMARLPALTPLADRYTRRLLQVIRMDVAMQEHAVDEMQALSTTLNDPYFQSIRENLQRNPAGRVTMGAFQPVWQKHNTCFPASIATVVQATPPLDADEIAAALTYGGTTSWRVLDWLTAHGFAAKPFIFTAALAQRLFQQGLSFIYMTEEDNWSHAMAAIGHDAASGTLIIHDPSQTRQTRTIMAKVEEYYGPFSPEALAIVPAGRAAELAVIPAEASRPLELAVLFWKMHQEQGWSETQPLLAALQAEFPAHPMTQRLHAIYFANTGRIADALQIQETLLASYPNSVQCRRDLLLTLKQTRDTGRIRQVYADFVELNVLPGVSQEKSYPSGIYVVDYADVLNFTSSDRAKATKYLQQVLLREPANAAAYHSLGDVLACQGRHAESILPFSIAACLKPEDDHYARAVCDAFVQSGDLAAGFAYLARRIADFGDSPHAAGAWLTQVGALENYGYPDQAIALFEQANRRFPDEPESMLFGTSFWLRMGRPEQARQLLETLAQKGHRLYFLEAAANFYYRRGEWEKALILATQWNALKPGDITAFRYYSHLAAFEDGRTAKIKLIREAVQQFANDEAFEELYFETLDELFRHEEKIALLRERVRRNSHDSWAWNELCHELVTKVELAEERRRPPMLAEVADVLQQCAQLGAGTFELCCLAARQKFCVGARPEAIALLFEALERNPAHPFPYTRIMDELRAFTEAEQADILQRLEAKLFCAVSFLSHAVDFAGKIAAQKGMAAAVAHVQQWRAQRPDDPELALGLARLWLDYGQSRSDAEKAAALLEPLVQRFPNHFDLSLALADADAILQRADDQIRAYRQMLDRDPLHQHARRQLSRVLAVSGRFAEAEQLLAEGCQIMPIDGRRWFDAALFYESRNQYAEALEVLRAAVRKLPEDIQLREQLIIRLLNHNLPAEARQQAEALRELYPEGAYCWYLLADTLHRSPDYSDLTQIEAFYRKALALNSALLAAAEGLAQLMASQRRYQEAHAVLNNLPEAAQDDPETRWLRAWIFRGEGQTAAGYAELETVLAKHPDFERAWHLVMNWLEEDQDWAKVKTLLAEIPPAPYIQLDFRTHRLELLQKAGIPITALDAEWEELTREFPENLRLQMSRFDVLVEAEQWDRAEELLAEAERFDPHASYLLARKVQLLAHRRKFAEALCAAVAIWTMPGDNEGWPENFAWEAYEKAGDKRALAQAALDALLAGSRLRMRVFVLLLQNLKLVQAALKRPWRERFTSFARLTTPARIQAYFTLMERLHTAAWDPAEHLAAVLNHLDEIKCYGPAVRHCLKHAEYYRKMTPVRQSAVMLMRRAPGNRYNGLVRQWMQDWRELPGIRMWSVVNYLLAVAPDDSLKTPRARMQEQFAASRDCLQTLAFDHTARYVCCLYCEAALRLGDNAAFAAGIERYRAVLADEKTEYWIYNRRKHLPHTLLLFEALDNAANPKECWEISRKLKRRLGYAAPFSWIARTWWQRTRGKLSWPRRLWLFGRLLLI